MTTNEEFSDLFAPDSPADETPDDALGWKVLLVDDADDIRAVVRLLLKDVRILDRPLSLIEARSGAEARAQLAAHPDIALILLDVVMETHRAGLDLVAHIRGELGNRLVQVILLTGEPGHAPQREVVTRYDIDGYRIKSELTADKLFFSVHAALRTYRAIQERDAALGEQRATQAELERHRDLLVAANMSLEDEVAKRTAELNLRNHELENDRKTLATLLSRIDQTEMQLLQSDKLAMIGQLAAGVAHEINNPVGFVSSNLTTLETYVGQLLPLVDAWASGSEAQIQTAQRGVDLPYLREDLPILIRESRDGVERVKKIVADLKNFSRADQSEPVDTDLNMCLASTLNIVWNELKYKAEVVRELGALPAVRCVPSQVGQVFMNVLVNAAQAIEKYGRITLRTYADAEHAWVEIIDTGRGIPESIHSRIFDPFFTTKPVGQGTGLGLSISRDIIVGRHQGRLELISRDSQGTTCRIGLPLGDALAAA